jgi:hypothetical protein
MKEFLSITPDNLQEKTADFVGNPHLFISGPASSGKTSAALLRLRQILSSDSRSTTLVLVPQRSLAELSSLPGDAQFAFITAGEHPNHE